jgi:hypothetical protein
MKRKRRYVVTVQVEVYALTEAGFRAAEARLREMSFDGWSIGVDSKGVRTTHDRSALKRVKVERAQPMKGRRP